jgi:hypothetical protein
MKYLATLSIIFISYTAIFAQDVCRQSCTVDPIYDTKIIKHYIFNGDDTTGLNVKITKITVAEARRELVKRRDPNCLSPNPVECIKEVWEVIPPVTMNLYTLPDPSKTDQYDVREESTTVMVKQGGQIEENVVCPKLRTKRMVSAIQKALISKGYPLTENGDYDQATSLAVIDFQKNVGLPYGDLTLATVAALGVR